jgi:hypothetical protein
MSNIIHILGEEIKAKKTPKPEQHQQTLSLSPLLGTSSFLNQLRCCLTSLLVQRFILELDHVDKMKESERTSQNNERGSGLDVGPGQGPMLEKGEGMKEGGERESEDATVGDNDEKKEEWTNSIKQGRERDVPDDEKSNSLVDLLRVNCKSILQQGKNLSLLP